MNITTIFLIRHGETTWNVEGRYQGQQDSPLTEQGILQAKELGKRLKDIPVDTIYSSDLGRAYDTAKYIADQNGQKVFKDTRLRERHFGVFQGLQKQEVQDKYPDIYSEYMSSGPDYSVPNGESTNQLLKRSMDCLTNLTQQHEGQSLGVVAHGGVLNVIIRHILGISLSAPRRFRLANCGLYTFSITDGTWYVETLNG